MTCESGWDARRVLQPIADAMGEKANAADRLNRALSCREELCRGSLGVQLLPRQVKAQQVFSQAIGIIDHAALGSADLK